MNNDKYFLSEKFLKLSVWKSSVFCWLGKQPTKENKSACKDIKKVNSIKISFLFSYSIRRQSFFA